MIYNDYVQIPGEEQYGKISSKLVKKNFARNNNEQVLDFLFEKAQG